jgi:hypothetical protein
VISAIATDLAFLIVRGGKTRLVSDLTAYEAESSNERESVGIDVGGGGRLVHEVTYRVVGQEESPYLLPDHLGCF